MVHGNGVSEVALSLVSIQGRGTVVYPIHPSYLLDGPRRITVGNFVHMSVAKGSFLVFGSVDYVKLLRYVGVSVGKVGDGSGKVGVVLGGEIGVN